MTYIQKFFGHLWTTIKHKHWVFHYSVKCGIPWLGLIHDLSKFSPIEFFESVKYYTGNGSPINRAKADKGYSSAWFHHRGRNKHHYEYWVDWLDDGGIPVKIPYKYVVEMVCDYLAAARTYTKKEFSYQNEYEWWYVRKQHANMHEDTKNFLEHVFASFTWIDEKIIFNNFKDGTYKEMYETGKIRVKWKARK